MSTSRTSVFEQEKARLVAEIAKVGKILRRIFTMLRPSKNIEELLSVSNDANRGLEDESRMTRDYIKVAQLWETFKSCIENVETGEDGQTETPGLPGTGGHVPGRSG
jgi:hypothetical protein